MSRRLLPAVLAALLVVAGCSTPDRHRHEPWPEADPARPVVDLALTLSGDHSRAEGLENIEFRPDAQVCDVVLRSWPDGPLSEGEDTALTIRSVTQNGRPLAVTTESAGAAPGKPGTLTRVHLPRCAAAGETVAVQVAFALVLGEDVDNRQGRSGRVAWMGTAFPMLAWVRGRGWVTEPAVNVVGETATSETFSLRRLDVTAPDGDVVTGVGQPQGTMRGVRPGTTLHRFSAPAVRDVFVSAGSLRLQDIAVDGTTITLATPVGAKIDTAAWTRRLTTSLRALRDRFGPVPYEHLWITIVPGVSSGVEFSGAVLFGEATDPDEDSWLVTHELAHQWFYGLVGNDQAANPWLDEAFATYAQEVVEPTSLSTHPDEWLGLEGRVGASMSDFAGMRRASDTYVATVYRGGGRALLEARQADGDPDAFDEAVRAYLRDEANRVARPEDVASHLRDLPGATATLRKAGALP